MPDPYRISTFRYPLSSGQVAQLNDTIEDIYRNLRGGALDVTVAFDDADFEHHLLDSTHHLDTTTGTPVTGDIITAQANLWTRLAKGSDGQFLKLVSGAPAWTSPSAWANQTFAAGDYTADSSTWTVASGDVRSNSYKVIDGNTLIWSLVVAATSSIGAGNSFLFVKLPGGNTTPMAAGSAPAKLAYFFNNATVQLDSLAAVSDSTHIVIHRGGVGLTAGSTAVSLTIILRVN